MAVRTTGATGREGFALAVTLLIILVLGILAVGASWLASREHKTTTAESVHVRALLAADAGSESAINFIRLTDRPPAIVDNVRQTVRSQGQTALDAAQAYTYGMRYVRMRPKPGWGPEYVDFEYAVAATGATGASGNSAVQVVATRLYRVGY